MKQSHDFITNSRFLHNLFPLCTQGYESTDTIERYDIDNDQWTTLDNVVSPRVNGALAISVGDNTAWVIILITELVGEVEGGAVGPKP